MELESSCLRSLLEEFIPLHTTVTSLTPNAKCPNTDELLSSILLFSERAITSTELFAERGLADRQREAPLSLQHVRNASELLSKYCEVLLARLPCDHLENSPTTIVGLLTSQDQILALGMKGAIVPQTVSLFLHLASSKHASKLVQKVVCGTLQQLADQFAIGSFQLTAFDPMTTSPDDQILCYSNESRAATFVRNEETVSILFHWMIAAAILTQSHHRTTSIRLARLCEMFASVPDHDSDRKGVVDLIKEYMDNSVVQQATNASAQSSESSFLVRIAMRFLAFSLSSWSRRCLLVESSGRCYSELGRLGSVLPRLATHGSTALLSIACSLLNVLSDDGGRTFDADPSIGEFLAVVMRERFCAPATQNSADCTAPSWSSHGVRHWLGDQVIRNSNIATGHKLDGALAVKVRELTKYFMYTRRRLLTSSNEANRSVGALNEFSESFAMSVTRSIADQCADVHLLDTGVPHLVRLIAMDYTTQMQEYVDSAHSTHSEISRSLIRHWKTSIACVATIITDGGSHRMASALLLLVQNNVLPTSTTGASSANRLSLTEQRLLGLDDASMRTITGADDVPLLAKCMQLLTSIAAQDQPDARLLSHVLNHLQALLRFSWNQNPRDLAPHLMELDVLSVLHNAAKRLMSLVPLPPAASSVADLPVKDYVVWLDICAVLCEATAEILELHEGIREAVDRNPQIFESIAASISMSWLVAAVPFEDVVHTEHTAVLPTLQIQKETLERCMSRVSNLLQGSSDAFKRALTVPLSEYLRTCHSALVEQGVSIDETTFWHCNSVRLSIETLHAKGGFLIGLSGGGDAFEDVCASVLAQRLSNNFEWPTFVDSPSVTWISKSSIAQVFVDALKSRSPAMDRTMNQIEQFMLSAKWSCFDLAGATTQPLTVLAQAVLAILSTDRAWPDSTGGSLSNPLRNVLRRGIEPVREGNAALPAVVIEAICGGSASPAEHRADQANVGRFRALFPLIPLFKYSLDDTRRLIAHAVCILRVEPASEVRHDILCATLRYALNRWDARQALPSDEDLSNWLIQADIAISLSHELQDIFEKQWHRVPLAIQVEVYALLRLLTQMTHVFHQWRESKENSHKQPTASRRATTTTSKKLWDDVTSRIRNVLAESVATFLISVPDMPLTCVNHALPLLELLALDVTQALGDSDIAAFWVKVVRQGILDRSSSESSGSSSSASLVAPIWLFRIVTVISHSAGSDSAKLIQRNQARSANLSMLSFMLVDTVACRVTALSEEFLCSLGTAESHTRMNAALSCADSLITVAWAALQPETPIEGSNEDAARPVGQRNPHHLCRKNLHVFLQSEQLEQCVILPLMHRVANPDLSSEVFYDRAFRGVLAAIRVAAHANAQLQQDHPPELQRQWVLTLRRLQQRSCATLEQLCYLSETYLHRVGDFLHQYPNVEKFLNEDSLAANGALSDATWEQESIVESDPSLWASRDLVYEPDVTAFFSQAATTSSTLCVRMLQIAADNVSMMQRRTVVESLFEQIQHEAALLPKDAQAAIATVAPKECTDALVASGLPAGCAQEKPVLLVDANVLLTELLHVVGAEDFTGLQDRIPELVGFVAFEQESPPQGPSTSQTVDGTMVKQSRQAEPPQKSKRKTAAAQPARKKRDAVVSKKPSASRASKDQTPVVVAPPRGHSKLYCFMRHSPGAVAKDATDKAVLQLLQRNVPLTEVPMILWATMMVPVVNKDDSSHLSPPQSEHRFVQICRQLAQNPQAAAESDRRLAVSTCCRVGLTSSLVNAALRHCSNILDSASDRGHSAFDEVDQILSGCFLLVGYFNHRALALSLKALTSDISCSLRVLLKHLSSKQMSTLSRPLSRNSENARSLILLMMICQTTPLSDLASGKPKFNLARHGYLRLDRYGAADDRDSFDDSSEFSDITALSGNHSTPPPSSQNDDDDENGEDDEELSGAPARLFDFGAGSLSSSVTRNSDEMGDDSGSEEEDDIQEDDVFDGDAIIGVKRSKTSGPLAVQLVGDIVRHTAPGGILHNQRTVLHRSHTAVWSPSFGWIVPLGENGRWLRYYHLTSDANLIVDLNPWHTVVSERDAHVALRAVVGHLPPMLITRSKVAHRLLLHLVGQLCLLDDYLMTVVTTLITIANLIPQCRLTVLRVVYSVTADRRQLSRCAPAMALSDFSEYDTRKITFFRHLLAFLCAPTMSVLSQRMITYVLSSTYSAEDEYDEDDEWGSDEDGRSSAGVEVNRDDIGSPSVERHTGSREGPQRNAPQLVDVDGDSSSSHDEERGDDSWWDEQEETVASPYADKMRAAIKPTLQTQHNGELRQVTELPRADMVGNRASGKQHPHPLMLTNTWEIPNYRASFSCDVCNRNGGSFTFHCKECQYDECVTCVLAARKQRAVRNEDFDVGGGPYYEPTDDYEITEREDASSNVFGHDQFLRLCHVTPLTPRPCDILLSILHEANCVDGCTEFLLDTISSFFHAAVFPWHHPTQSKQPPFLPEVSRADICSSLIPFVCKSTSAFLQRRTKSIEEAKRLYAALEARASKLPADEEGHRAWDIEAIGEAVYVMDSLHAEATEGAQVMLLLPLCVNLCPDQQQLNILDGLVQHAWDVLTAHYSLLSQFLKHIGDDGRAYEELYGTVTMSQGNISLLVVIGKYYRAINWRNTYVARMSQKSPSARLHQVPLKVLTSTAAPAEMRAQSSLIMLPSESDLFGMDDGAMTPQSSNAHLQSATFSSSEVVRHVKKSELVLEVLALRRGATAAGAKSSGGGRPTTANSAAAASKEVKSEAEDPWNEQRSEEIASIVGFAKSYRLALNFLIASRNDPSTTLDSGVDFLLNTSKILEFSIRLAAFRAKMMFHHENAEDQYEITVSRGELLVSTFREMFTLQADLSAAAKGKDSKVSAMQTQIEVVFSEEEAMDAGGVKREWISLVFQRLIQLTDQIASAPAREAKLPFSNYLDDWLPPILVRSGDTSGGAFELNPTLEPSEEVVSITRVLGMLVGFAVSYDMPIDLHLTRAMYSHMIGRQPNLKDLEATDPDLYKNLKYITSITTEDDMEALCLAFTAPCARGATGTTSSMVNGEVALVPRGADIPVTLTNRNEYIRRRADHRMTQQSHALMVPFLEGFHLTMPIGFLQCFTSEDLELVSCGVSSVDVEDLRAHTTYEGFQMSSPQVRWFWECCATMSQQDLVKLVQFATASTRPPAGGFASLHPPLTLVRCPTSENLPVAHTCMNRIDLPEYESATVLREKLKQALAFGNVGFGLV